jgi:hypothetical protein
MGGAILAVAVGFNEVQYSTLLKPQQQAKLDHDTRLCRGHTLLRGPPRRGLPLVPRERVTDYDPRLYSCRDARQTIRKPCLIGPPSVLYPAMRAARVDDNVRHALKALRVGLDFGRNFLAGLRASNHKNAHLTLASHPVHARA